MEHLTFLILNINLPKDVTISPVSIVTALVDRIHVHGKLFPDQDVKISGHVSSRMLVESLQFGII